MAYCKNNLARKRFANRLLLILIYTLTACAIPFSDKGPIIEPSSEAWQTYLSQQSNLTTWHIHGQFSLMYRDQFMQPIEFYWYQHDIHADITFLRQGVTIAQMHATVPSYTKDEPTGVSPKENTIDIQTHQSLNTDALLTILDRFPIKQLAFWLRGLPGNAAVYTAWGWLDNVGNVQLPPTQINQDGVAIHYLSWHKGNLLLPKRVRIVHAPFTLTAYLEWSGVAQSDINEVAGETPDEVLSRATILSLPPSGNSAVFQPSGVNPK